MVCLGPVIVVIQVVKSSDQDVKLQVLRSWVYGAVLTVRLGEGNRDLYLTFLPYHLRSHTAKMRQIKKNHRLLASLASWRTLQNGGGLEEEKPMSVGPHSKIGHQLEIYGFL